jgi:hypothetical protein
VEVATFLRLLWRRRLRAVIGLALSVLAGMALAKHTPAYGVATTSVIVDTPRSEIAANSSQGMDTLYWRATLLGMMIGAEPTRHEIASGMHLSESEINISDLELGAPADPASLPVAALKAANNSSASYTLNAYTDDVLPVIHIAALAPDGASAARLARTAVTVLEAGGARTSTPTVQALKIQQVAPITLREKAASAGHTKMAIMAVIIFMFWCIAFIVIPAARGGTPSSRGGRRRRLRPRRPIAASVIRG